MNTGRRSDTDTSQTQGVGGPPPPARGRPGRQALHGLGDRRQRFEAVRGTGLGMVSGDDPVTRKSEAVSHGLELLQGWGPGWGGGPVPLLEGLPQPCWPALPSEHCALLGGGSWSWEPDQDAGARPWGEPGRGRPAGAPLASRPLWPQYPCHPRVQLCLRLQGGSGVLRPDPLSGPGCL